MGEMTKERKHQIVDQLNYIADLCEKVENAEFMLSETAGAVGLMIGVSSDAWLERMQSVRYRKIAAELKANIG